LPELNERGDLPEGVHAATLTEVLARFGGGSSERQAASARLARIYRLAIATGKLRYFLIFGSYVTSKQAPNDVDVILVMFDDFVVAECSAETQALFDHQAAALEFGASIFWTRPGAIFGEPVEEFLASWQIKRDKSKQGVIEVRP